MNTMVQDNLDEYSRRPERSRRKSLPAPMKARLDNVDPEVLRELNEQGFDFTTNKGLEFEDEDQ
jgi:hypothetical protein